MKSLPDNIRLQRKKLTLLKVGEVTADDLTIEEVLKKILQEEKMYYDKS